MTTDSYVIVTGSPASTLPVPYTTLFRSACGNHSECVQTITVNDTTAPVITQCAPDATVQCASLVPAANDRTGRAHDSTPVTETATKQSAVIVPGSCASKFTVTRTYHATD